MVTNLRIEGNGWIKRTGYGGWGFSSVVEHLPRKRKALGSVPSSEKKRTKKKKNGIWERMEDKKKGKEEDDAIIF